MLGPLCKRWHHDPGEVELKMKGVRSVDDNKLAAFVAVAIAVVGLVAVAGMTYGCVSTSNRYYDAQGQCVSAGGTWIPTAGSGACVAPSGGKRTEP